MTGSRAFTSPEEQHLLEQERLVADLTEQLVARETEFATTGATFARFRAMYASRFAPLYAELDALEADIARRIAATQRTKASRQHATASAAQAKESAAAAKQLGEATEEVAFRMDPAQPAPSEQLRNLYRQAARTVHPDLAPDDVERARRTLLMTAVNAVYAAHDLSALERLLNAELARPEAVTGDDVASRLIRAIRRLAQVRGRLRELQESTEALTADPLFIVFEQARPAWEAGEDPLADDEADVRERIAEARSRLASLNRPKRPRTAAR